MRMDSGQWGLKLAAALILAVVSGGAAAAESAEEGGNHPKLSAQRAQQHEFALSTRGFEAFNAKQQIAVEATDVGLRLATRDRSEFEDDAVLSLAAAGLAEDVAAVRSAGPLVAGRQVEYLRGPFTEWYANTPRGLEAGLTIHQSLTGRAVFEFAIGGSLSPKATDDERAFWLEAGARGPVLVYGGLTAHDDAGREIPARWEQIPDASGSIVGLRLVLTLENHVAPYHVEGLITRSMQRSTSEPKPAAPALGEEVLGPAAVPSNDDCSGAEVIPAAGPFPYLSGTYDIMDATSTGDPPRPSCQNDVSRSVWFTFTPSTTRRYTLALCAEAGTATTIEDSVLAVYTSSNGTCSGRFSEVTGGCDDDSCSVEALQSAVINLNMTAGTTYYVVAYKFAAYAPAVGFSSLQLRVSDTAAPPANDTCAGAQNIPDGPYPVLSQVTSDITAATTTGDPAAPSCQTNVSRSIWYTFTPTQTATYEISTCFGSGTATTVDDTIIAVYHSSNGTCSGTFTQVTGGCADDTSCDNEFEQAILESVSLTQNTKYYILVHAYQDSLTPPPPPGSTAVQVRINRIIPPPANDTCAAAEVIPSSSFPVLSTVTPDITGGTSAGDPAAKPSCQSNVSRSIWYTFTPAVSGGYEISTCAGSGTGTTVDDTVLAVYTSSDGTCGGGFTRVAGGCDDNACASEANQALLHNLPLTSGTTYYILVHMVGTSPPAAGNTAVQVRINRNPAGPPNDQCAGAEVVPAGPYPVLSTVTSDITYATSTADPTPSCQSNVSRGIWYSFTPAVNGTYNFSVCADAPTATTVDDTVMAIYRSSDGTCAGTFTQVSGGCDNDTCVNETSQSVISSRDLTAGTPYYVLVYKYNNDPPAASNTAVQLRISQNAPPANDRCANAQALQLNAPVSGTTSVAANDYELPFASSCFSGVGQAWVTSPGRDVVYTFTAPSAGLYSFRTTGYSAAFNSVLYVASDCPAAAPPANITGCLKAANRTTAAGAEEVDCYGLEAGQRVYVYADDALSSSAGSAFTIEVNRCVIETEPNGAPGIANEGLVCGQEGSISPAAEFDFFRLYRPEANSRVFVLADGIAANAQDFDLRVTTTTDTLEYDDQNADSPYGGLSAAIAGTKLTGTDAFVQVSNQSTTAPSEPWRLYAAVQPPDARATAEVEPNDAIATASSGPNEYFSGALSATTDADYFTLTASAGELIFVALDPDPTRTNTPFNPTLALLDSAGTQLLLVNDSGSMSSTGSGAGSLAATQPHSPAEGLTWRARYSGTYYVRVGWGGGTPGDYLLSITHDCKVKPGADLAVSMNDAPDPVFPGVNVTYAVTVSNLGAGPAALVLVRDDLPANGAFVSATPSQGTCGGSGPVFCSLGTIAAGGAATISVVVEAPVTGPASMTNTVRVSSANVDPNAGNDTNSQTTAVAAGSDSDGDGVADTADCAPGNNAAWAVPDPATDLRFGSNKIQLTWLAPAVPGGTVVSYDVLRSGSASNFSAPFCVAKDVTATSASDAAVPEAAYNYLVRSKNACGGNAGTDSAGAPRSAGSCP